MRLVRFRPGQGAIGLGLLEGDTVRAVPGWADPEAVLEAGALASLGEASRGAAHAVADVVLLAPLVRPSKVICVGRNYPEHARETGSEPPTEPVIFSKFASAIAGPADDIVLPALAPRRVDYEAELAVVIGRAGRDIEESAALDHVAGYMASNDVTARDWQLKRNGGQWLLGKTFDSFLPLGPALVTRDEVPDVENVRVRCLVDGEELQNDVIASMIFSIPQVIAHVSRVMTLLPGDLLLTGTPAGVGLSRTPPRWLAPGQVVETVIEGVGTLTNAVRAADGAQ